MDKMTFDVLGDVPVIEPDNWCCIADLSHGWVKIQTGGVSEIMQQRVCAAAIGMVFDKSFTIGADNKSVPEYDVTAGDLFKYGAVIQDLLLKQGVSIMEMATVGVEVFGYLSALIPKRREVDEQTDFIEAEGAA